VEGGTWPSEYGAKSDYFRRRDGDEELFILNETAVRHFGLEDPVGKTIDWSGVARGRVIGVVKDFHVRTMHEPMEPVAFTAEQSQMKFPYLKVHTQDIGDIVDHLAASWSYFLLNRPVQYEFLDDRLNWYYEVEQRTEQAFEIFTAVAILVACLGLFGLASYSVEHRRREIGVRKALGASARSVVFLVSREFLYPVLFANAIAWPAAYLALSSWLQRFAYRIELSPWLFLASSAVALVIAAVTVGSQSAAAASTDPVRALREQ
jgi:putative ABC transport system permease protein